ncbi:N-acetyl-alpha-D-glucosaminyl L-malate synthase [Actinidia chinensis var. chinensis]|uniref:N-acetyl-alpha-D-glucosaminyl L-malate synthase n=1 Tax=Actinidia chinensis var. chinensis TaxID=1590841 RepID=A0A2R6QFQ2_ACTCC|nr:N-acetyl-alpha-D-glucosaminyl L-malate synthase [Actinidia chinensis var. chinensis]
MEDGGNKGDFLGNLVRPSPLRTGGSLKSTSSGKLTPRGSPSFRRLNSSRTPRREGRSSGSSAQWFRSNRIVLWLLLITLWAYAGFYVQSRWAHGDNKQNFLGYGGKPNNGISEPEENHRRELIANDNSSAVKTETDENQSSLKKIDVVLAKKGNDGPSHRSLKKKSKKSVRGLRSKTRGKQKVTPAVEATEIEEQEPEIPNRNTSYGLLVGPFGSTEDRILEWSPEKRSGTCDRKGEFARLVWSRKFLFVFHELSMTGAPVSMMELATEFLSCGATISVVVLNKKGVLMQELVRRKIKVLDDSADHGFKTAMKSDLVIAGSAACASWIDQYMERFPAGSKNVVWWVMENRREYFDRSKLVLSDVKMLIFLSESQYKQWLAWCAEENIKLKSQIAVIPLSVNDELAFVAGIHCSLNTPSSGPEKMLDKRKLLRNAVREEMGLTDNDMLVMALSSINAGKGQLLLLESAQMVVEKEISHDANIRKLISESRGMQEQTLKVLIGSVGSKSNKVTDVKAILSFVSQHSNLSKSVLWTPETTRVAALYSAADAYVMNSQGLGETFGRVTIEAMAFGLPVLGTDAGGTKGLVEHNVTGLLHPLGRPGTQVLAENLRFLLKNPLARQEMGARGRKKVEHMYLKRHMFKKFAQVLFRSMRIK